MRRPSSRCSALALLCASVACSCSAAAPPAGAAGAVSPSVGSAPARLDLADTAPPLATRAPRDDLSTLRAPLAATRAEQTVLAFFEAVFADDADALARLLAPGALVVGPRGGPSSALDHWRIRLRRVGYARAPSAARPRAESLSSHAAADFARATPGLALGVDFADGDVVVRVATRGAVDALFGDPMVFVVRATGRDAAAVTRIVEEFQVP